MLLTGLLCWYALPFVIPLPAGLQKNQIASPVLRDRNGTPIIYLTLSDSTRATPVSLKCISADLIACTLAAEDKRFFKHSGVDLFATLRASRDFLIKRRVVSGASTITQQLVKISTPAAKRNAFTKVREILAARRLEMTWSKQQILSAYLNHLDYGNLRMGSAEAARFYFQKPLADLSLAECALLAGLPQAPSRLNPIRYPDRAIRRRDLILHRLMLLENSTAARVSTALTEPLTLRPLSESQFAPWLAAQANHLSSQNTTLDLPLQRDLETIVQEETGRLKDANLRHAAVVVIHNATGEILALLSSANWNDPRGGQFNGALSPRSPGSTLKPFTYLLAMERDRLIPSSILDDIPTPFFTPQGLHLPENYDRHYRGPVTLRTALACSLNVPALRELNQLGGPAPLHHLLVSLGITTLGDDPSFQGIGLTLGNAQVRLLELTNAYATLARQGRHFPPVLILGNQPTERLLFDPTNAYLIADILSDTAARAPSFQPGGPLDLPFRCAVKTGTSSDFHDNWCIGFTPEFTVGVWAGNFEHQPMKGLSGIAGAGPIFHRSMLRVQRDSPPRWYQRPSGLIDIVTDVRTGKIIPADENNRHVRRDFAPSDRLPLHFFPSDYDSDGKAFLPAIYREWFTSRHNLRLHELALNPSPHTPTPLRIISPTDNAIFLLDPEIPSGSDKLRPITNLPGTAQWRSNTLHIEAAKPEPIIHLTLGTHILTATDPNTGETHTLTLQVKSL